jgi:16S rRNA (cytidine1402-2'-O)-methyltransferase
VLEALGQADTVCAEDTRVTARLLAAHQIRARLERLDEERISSQAQDVVKRVLAGEVIAYCSDAGMPGVSDPGARLVQTAWEQGAKVEVLPGASAGITAYVASGFVCPRYYFGGFFPRKAGERKNVLEALKGLDAVLLFYESPHRLVAALEAIATAMPERIVAVCRELTKLHEEVLRAPVGEALALFSERARQAPLKGEIVLVVDAPSSAEQSASVAGAVQKAKERARGLKEEEGLSHKDKVKLLQAEYGITRNAAYDLILATEEEGH